MSMKALQTFSRASLLALALLMAACSANHKSIYRHEALAPGPSITLTDAKQRAILATGNTPGTRRFCAEPSPDVFAVIAQSLSVGGVFGQQADPKAIELALNAAFASSEQASTIPRTQTINMLRELMFRTCERYMNGGISSLELPLQAIRDQRLMVSILAIEQLTGVAASKAVALGAAAEATAGASAAGGMAILDKARSAVKTTAATREDADKAYKLKVKAKVDGADKEFEACVALDGAQTDEAKQALPKEVTDKSKDCEKLKGALDKATAEHEDAKAYYDKQAKLANASGVPVSASTSLMTPVIADGLSKTVNGSTVDLSKVVFDIVDLNFKQDEFLFLCLKTLSHSFPDKDKEIENQMRVTCLDYVKATVKSEQARVDLRSAELSLQIKRLTAGTDDQFEAFWKAISDDGGAMIDPMKYQSVRARVGKLSLRWPDCFTESSSKATVQICFRDKLVQGERDRLLQATKEQ
jgi:hypothetical protein